MFYFINALVMTPQIFNSFLLFLTPFYHKTFVAYNFAFKLVNVYMWIYDLELGDGSSLTTEGHIIRFILQVLGVLLSLWIWKFRTRDR